MPLTPTDRERIRYHMGYPAISSNASIQFGLPAFTEMNFVIETAMDKLLEPSIPRVRDLLQTLDDTETNIRQAQQRLAASRLGEITMNEGEPDKLEREYRRWAERLADIMASPLYAYSTRFRETGAVFAGSIPVRH